MSDGSKGGDARKPNIILITTHDSGRFFGCYGTPVPTTNVDRLAAEGAVFEQYFCTAAQCSPSRGSIMTGRFPHENGLMGLAHLGWRYHPGERTLAHELAAAGYDTLLFGVQHEDRGDGGAARLGYETVASQERQVVPVARDLASWLRQRARSGSQEPFFAAAGCSESHLDWGTGEPTDPAAVEVPPYLPDEPLIREELARFYGSILQIDQAIGIMTEALAETGLDQNTLFVLTVDQGAALPRAKGTGYDPGLETALVMRWPGVIPAGARYQQLLSNVDLLPTLLDAAGIERQASLPLAGRSFWPLLTGKGYKEREAIFLEMTWHDRYNPLRGIRTRRHKCILNFDPDGPACFLPADTWRSPCGQRLRQELAQPGRPPVELYDLAVDPGETSNLAGQPQHAQLCRQLEAEIRGWMAATGDPLLAGHVVPPRAQAERLQREISEGSQTVPISRAERQLVEAALR